MGMLQMKRVYEAPEEQDGYRILVDRLWPRGISREKAKLDLWAKSIAPTNELRGEGGCTQQCRRPSGRSEGLSIWAAVCRLPGPGVPVAGFSFFGASVQKLRFKNRRFP